MKTLQEIRNKVAELIRFVKGDRQSEIRSSANGGNSIVLVCPPQQEKDFIEVLHSMLGKNDFNIIDLNILLIEYIENNRDFLEEAFGLLQSSLYQIFKTPYGECSNDFYHCILEAIQASFDDNKVPIVVNTGTLYATGIENIHLMENDLVMNSKTPIVILYPAEDDGGKLMFLGARPASKYRCIIL